MNDPFARLTDSVLLTDYLDLLVQLEKGTGTRPILWLLKDARDNARVALGKLIEVDATETEAIRSLQAEVRLFSDLAESCARLVVRGREADRRIDDAERTEFAEMLTPEDAERLGIDPPPED